LPVIVQTTDGLRYRFFLATLDILPEVDLIVYDDAPGEGWTVKGAMGESDPASTSFVRTGKSSHEIGPGSAAVEYLYDEPEGLNLFGYSHLEFYINGGEDSEQDPIIVKKDRNWLVTVPEAYTWNKVSIPVSELTNPLYSISIRGSRDAPFYVDDMRLVVGELHTE
jgi:hypothetical protein